jgi:hypothetical protein
LEESVELNKAYIQNLNLAEGARQLLLFLQPESILSRENRKNPGVFYGRIGTKRASIE